MFYIVDVFFVSSIRDAVVDVLLSDSFVFKQEKNEMSQPRKTLFDSKLTYALSLKQDPAFLGTVWFITSFHNFFASSFLCLAIRSKW